MKQFEELIGVLESYMPMYCYRKARPEEYEWTNVYIDPLIKRKYSILFGEDPFLENTVRRIVDYLTRPIIIFHFIEDKYERIKILQRLEEERPDAYALFLTRRNSTKNLEYITATIPIVLPLEDPTHQKFLMDLKESLQRQRNAIAEPVKALECIEDTTRIILEWCVSFITSPIIER